jgi:hypothetical protein
MEVCFSVSVSLLALCHEICRRDIKPQRIVQMKNKRFFIAKRARLSLVAIALACGMAFAGCDGDLNEDADNDRAKDQQRTLSGKVAWLEARTLGTVYAYEETELLGQAAWNSAFEWTLTLSKPAMDGIAFVVVINDPVEGKLESKKFVVDNLREWDNEILPLGYEVSSEHFPGSVDIWHGDYTANRFSLVSQGSDAEIYGGAFAGRRVSFIIDSEIPLSEFTPYPPLTIDPPVEITDYQIVDGGDSVDIGGDGKVARVDFIMPASDLRVHINFFPNYDPDNAQIADGRYQDGYVLPLKQATEGAGINLVLYGDGWLSGDLSVGGNWETAARASLERFFALPVIRDFTAYFNVYALMVTSPQTVTELNASSAYQFQGDKVAYMVGQMPQIKGKERKTTIFYIANGPAGGYMTTNGDFAIGVYSYGAESSPQYCIFHEIMGHAFASLADEYSGDAGDADSRESIRNMQNDGFGLNCSLEHTRDTVEWKDFLNPDGSGKTGYADMGIFEGGFVKSTGVWRSIESSVMRNNPAYNTSGWQRYCVYKRIMDLAEKPFTLADFFTYDEPNTLIDDWAVEIAETVTLP